MATKAKKQIWTWRQAVAESDITTHTKALCWTLALDLTDAGRYVQISVKEIMRLSGMSNRAVATHIAKAVDAGLLVEPERRHDPSTGHVIGTRYRLRFPDHMELSREPAQTPDEPPSSGPKSRSERGSSRAAKSESLSEPPSGLSEPRSRQEPDSNLTQREDSKGTTATAAARDQADVDTSKFSTPARGKRDLFQGQPDQPKPLDPNLARAYTLLRNALAVHERPYEVSPQRDRCLLGLGIAYIERLAAKIPEAKALKWGVMPWLQTNQIIEDADIRAKLFDREYDHVRGDAEASKPAVGEAKGTGKRSASKAPPEYTPEFVKFWDACPASSRAKGGKEAAFDAFQILSPHDRSDVMTVALAGVWEEPDIDDARYAMNVKRWIEGESWVALAEMYEISLYYFGRKQAAAAKEEAPIAEVVEVDEDEEPVQDVPEPINERRNWLSCFISDRMPHAEIIRCHGHHLRKYAADHLLTAPALNDLRHILIEYLCNETFEFFIQPGHSVDWELAARIEEAASSLFHGMGEVIEYHDGKCPRSWTEGLAERDALEYGDDEWDKLVLKTSKQFEDAGVR